MQKQVKKVVFAALVAAVGFAAQANMLVWQVSDIKSSSANKLTGTGQYLAYLYTAKVDPDTATVVASGNGKITSISAIQDMLSSDETKGQISDYAWLNGKSTGRLNDSYSADAGTAGYSWLNVGQIGIGSAGYTEVSFFAIVLNAQTVADATEYMLLSDNGNPLTQRFSEGSYGATTWVQFDFGSQANNSWIAIPEPTSGLLMVLGMAALALKRKRA